MIYHLGKKDRQKILKNCLHEKIGKIVVCCKLEILVPKICYFKKLSTNLIMKGITFKIMKTQYLSVCFEINEI